MPVNNFSVDIANKIFESGIANYSEPNFYFTNLLLYVPNDTHFPSGGTNSTSIINGMKLSLNRLGRMCVNLFYA